MWLQQQLAAQAASAKARNASLLQKLAAAGKCDAAGAAAAEAQVRTAYSYGEAVLFWRCVLHNSMQGLICGSVTILASMRVSGRSIILTVVL